MKKLITMTIMVLAVAAAMAQSPEKFTYQAVVRNASNSLVANAPVGVRVSILQGSASGSAVYVETQTATTNANGLVTLSIGGGNVQQGTFADIDWANGPYFLKTETDPNGESNYSITSTQQMLSVPYALYAKDAGNIPTIPTNVSAFDNDAGYLTAQDIPVIPTVPTNVSAFTNDAGYLTNYTENDPVFNAWDKNYNDLTNKPTIPTIPTNVSAFTNDAGYITSYTETDPNVPAWAKESTKPNYDYSEIANTPTIPIVPTNVSAFENDVPYLTSFTEQQVLSISNDTIFLTGGSFVKLPEGFSGDYNDLMNTPTIPTVPTTVSSFTNDAGYLTSYTETDPNVPAWAKEATKPAYDYSEIANTPEIPTVPTNVSAFTNDAGYLIGETQTLSDVTAQGNSAGNRQLKDVSDPTEAYDAVNLHILTQLMDSVWLRFQKMQNQVDSLQALINNMCPCTQDFVCGTSTVTDHEGNVYHTIRIGDQCWTKENLRTTTSPSTGTYLIPPTGTNCTYTGKQARWYNNDSTTYAPQNYGLLYNWNAAVDTFNTAYGETSVNLFDGYAVTVSFTSLRRGICPIGWHLPSDAEWTTLTDYVKTQSEYVCGATTNNIAKALTYSEGWNASATPCAVGNDQSSNNATSFGTMPAGYFYNNGFVDYGNGASFWSATKSSYGVSNAMSRYFAYINPYVYSSCQSMSKGYSVRCLRDETNGEGTAQTQPTVTTEEATDVTSTSATLNGTISNPDNVTITAQGFEWKTSEGGNYTTVDASGEAMSYNLTGLTANIGYTYRAFVMTEDGTIYGEEVSFITLIDQMTQDAQPCPGAATVTDIDGNVYNTVQIGEQCWMKENMRTTRYSNGAEIPLGTFSSDPIGRFCPNNQCENVSVYGYLYNWSTAMNFATSSSSNPSNRQGICPIGWHLPSDVEWEELINYVNAQNNYLCLNYSSDNFIAKSLASTIGWNNSTTSCAVGNDLASNDLTGFGAMPAGSFGGGFGGSYSSFGGSACFWSTTETSSSDAKYFSVGNNSVGVDLYTWYKNYAFSVRCLRNPVGGGSDTTQTSLPTVSLNTISTITADTILCGSEVTDDGGSPIIACGVCWSTNGTPTIEDNHTVDSMINDGTFTGVISTTDWEPCRTLYHFRSYATNGNGTSYSDVIMSLYVQKDTLAPYIQYSPNQFPYTSLLPVRADNCTYNAPSKEVMVNALLPLVHDDYTDMSFDYLMDHAEFYWENTTISAPDQSDIFSALNHLTIVVVVEDQCGNELNNIVFYIDRPDDMISIVSPSVTSSDTAICESETFVLTFDLSEVEPSYGFEHPHSFEWICLENDVIFSNANWVETVVTPNHSDTTYHFQMKVTDMHGCTAYSEMCSIQVLDNALCPVDGQPCLGTPTVTDHEGNVYNTVQIGDQCWTRENMRTTTSPSTGTYLIPPATNSYYTYTGKQARWYNNDSVTYAPLDYGLLYNWYAAVDTFNTSYGETSVNDRITNDVSVSFSGYRRGICPMGWHVPSDAEWTELENYVASQSQFCCSNDPSHIAKALAASSGWNTSSINCAVGNDQSNNNATDFSAMPIGSYNSDGHQTFGYIANFWSSTESPTSLARYRSMFYKTTHVGLGSSSKPCGYSVRCLRD